MSTLHEIATREYTAHYSAMNPTLDAALMPRRFYRNLELMYGSLVNRLASGEVVGDLGCGSGFLLHWLAGKPGLSVVGVDASPGQAALARTAAPQADVHCMDALSFLRSQRRFGGLFCNDMLEHLETENEMFALLQAVHEVLAPGGFFVCRVPNAAHVLGSYSRYMDITHHRSFTSHSLKQALSAAGFENIQLIPTRSSIWLGRLRLRLEYWLHRALFLLGGYTMEDTFTQNVIAVGFKP